MAGIIFLHGPSSSGKTTLARAVQAILPEPFWHYSIDHLRDSGVLPMMRFRSGEFSWQAQRDAFFDGFHRSVAAFADAGNNLILEHILDTPGWLGSLADLLSPHDVLFVGLHLDLEALKRRELARGDRPAGSAAADFRSVHNGLRYDLDIDSAREPEVNARTVVEAWYKRSSRSVLFAAADEHRRPSASAP